MRMITPAKSLGPDAPIQSTNLWSVSLSTPDRIDIASSFPPDRRGAMKSEYRVHTTDPSLFVRRRSDKRWARVWALSVNQAIASPAAAGTGQDECTNEAVDDAASAGGAMTANATNPTFRRIADENGCVDERRIPAFMTRRRRTLRTKEAQRPRRDSNTRPPV